ncbi:esterase-like activity of phytase family protein [Janibacter sp. G368]|uniref:esterase-like activity of phytase family protein n=1 Tax=Janibacter sp. G368 TaxID=3420441 RepID=UPI003D0754B2
MPTPRLTSLLALGLSATLTTVMLPSSTAAPSPQPGGERADGRSFHRLATVPAYANTSKDQQSVAEISTVTADGNTVVYTDAASEGIGFVDITDPEHPAPDGFVEVPGEPTSVFATDDRLLVVVDTSESFTDPSGVVIVLDPQTREELGRLDLGGQPDSVDVTKGGERAFIAMENQRDEEAGDGGLPQEPAGDLAMIDLTQDVADLAVEHVDLTGLSGIDTPQDPEPEYVKISPDGSRVALTLQENNAVVILDAETGEVRNHFSAGSVALTGVDDEEDGDLRLDGSTEAAPREPDAIAWVDDEHVATANEGDWKGGTRGWTVFDAATGDVTWDAGTSFEDLAHRYGQYPEHRAGKKGTEPEGIAVATYDGTPYAFVGSERGNYVAVYDVSDPAQPVFTQLVPSTVGPEGILPIPSRDLLVISSEEDSAEDLVRGTIQVHRLQDGPAASPTLKSADARPADSGGREGAPITWSALGALSAVPGTDDEVYAAPDNFLSPSRIYTVDTASQREGGPATITDQLVLSKDGEPVGYDVEGLWADADGSFWLAVEGTAVKGGGSEGNRLVHVDAQGAVTEEVDLPVGVAAGLGGQGFEGVTGYGTGDDAVLYAAVQRASSTDPKGVTRIGRYTVATGRWEWFGYELESTETEGDWIGLSEITAVDEDTLAVIERDKLNGPDAKLKAVYAVDLPKRKGAKSDRARLPVLDKELAVDVLPQLRGLNGWTQEKLEGLTIAGNGHLYSVTDNDGVKDASGETVFLDLGSADEIFDLQDDRRGGPGRGRGPRAHVR